MKRVWIIMAVLMLSGSSLIGGRITESLENWVLGANVPEVVTGTRGDGSNGKYLHFPVGTQITSYELPEAGKGRVIFWLYDPGTCLDSISSGYGTYGPRWGLRNPLGMVGTVGINRKLDGCRGYATWASVAPSSSWWFQDGIRGNSGVPYSPGWYKWTIIGTYNELIFYLHDVDYDIRNGDDFRLVHGDVEQLCGSNYRSGTWALLYGEGWDGFSVIGDNPYGVENISVDVTGGTGVFADVGNTSIASPYTATTWGNIKILFR